MRRAALICGIVAVLLLADGIYMEVSNYQPGDQNAFTGNPNIILSDGQVVLISGGLLLLATVVMWLAAARKGSSH
jgi:cell division protein FtsX